MSGPDGPTGVITLKKIADTTYAQYGSIVLSSGSLTQVTMSASTSAAIFQPNIEQQVTWIEDFASRVQGTPQQSSQSSFHNAQRSGWQGGAYQHAANTDGSAPLRPTALLDGSVSTKLTTVAVALPSATLEQDEAEGGNQITSHVSRNPTFYMRWAQTSTTSGGTMGIGWCRGGGSFTNLSLGAGGLLAGIYFRCALPGGDIVGCCRTFTAGPVRVETTLSCGVSASAGVYHTGRIVITGAGAAVEFLVDGVSKGSITTNIPTEIGAASLMPSIGSSNANIDVIDVDYMAMSQQRTP